MTNRIAKIKAKASNNLNMAANPEKTPAVKSNPNFLCLKIV